MAGIAWTNEELYFLQNNYLDMSCEEIAGRLNRTIRGVQHKFNELKLQRPQPKVGDKINRLTIKELYTENTGTQNRTMAKVTCECNPERVFSVRLTAISKRKTKSCGCLKSEIQRERAIERNTKHGQSINGNVLFKRWCNLKFKYDFCPGWNKFPRFEQWCLDQGWTPKHFIRRYNEDESFNPFNCYILHKNHSKERIYKIWAGMFIRCYKVSFKQYCSYGGRGIRVCDQWWNYINFLNWSLENGYNDDLSIDKIDNNYHYCPQNCRWATQEQQNESRHNNRQLLAFGEVKSIIHWTKDSRCLLDIQTLKDRLLSGWNPEEAITKEKEPV